MTKTTFLSILVLIFIVGFTLGFSNLKEEKTTEEPSTLAHSMEQATDSPFDLMMKVLTHKRCVNCHPSGDQPRQGEDSHYHNFAVQRGADNHGVVALRCETCHQHENNDFSGVPGAPEWSLAPIEMAWEGLSRVEIARSMLNRENNGNRSLDEIVKHLTEHELVLWAWEPGLDAAGNAREIPPVSKEDYIKAVKEWAATGAVIPEK